MSIKTTNKKQSKNNAFNITFCDNFILKNNTYLCSSVKQIYTKKKRNLTKIPNIKKSQTHYQTKNKTNKKNPSLKSH